ncbi:MAG: 1-acyl-sn-glycerol-3-phosphate acyltransferase [Erysipelotrichaceae bacterium]|jgi:1-acyl-sn-glycerol-3-phosphate acyltransferase|nr:1-acyl-sn-glycerol-3-phosphate acyltransferase [Erysipelotrichaceae bacterium]
MFRIIKVLLIVAWRILFEYFVWIRRYAKNPKKYPLELRYQRIRKLCLFVLKHLKVKYYLKDIDKLNKIEGSFLLICNHLSYLDPICMMAASETPLTFLAKHQVKKYPFVGKCLIILEGRFINHRDLRDTLGAIRDIENDFKDNSNRHWVIFPEGSRNLKNDTVPLLPFFSSSFRIPLATNISFAITTQMGSQLVANKKKTYRYTPYQWHLLSLLSHQELVKYDKDGLQKYAHELMLNEVQSLKISEQNLIDSYYKKRRKGSLSPEDSNS